MGCCQDRGASEELKDAASLPPKPAGPPATKAPGSEPAGAKPPAAAAKPAAPAEKKPDPPKNEAVIHLKPGSSARLLKVYQVLAGDAKVVLRETADLRTISARIPRYPTAEYKGQILSGEKVIARYLAQTNNLYPRTPEEVYECESLVDQINDMWMGLSTVNADTLYQQAELLGAIERRLKQGSKFFVGPKNSMADVFVFCFLMEFYLNDSVKDKMANAVPKRLQDFVTEAKNNPLFRK